MCRAGLFIASRLTDHLCTAIPEICACMPMLCRGDIGICSVVLRGQTEQSCFACVPCKVSNGLNMHPMAHMMLQVMTARQARSLRPAVGARLTFWWETNSALGLGIAMQVCYDHYFDLLLCIAPTEAGQRVKTRSNEIGGLSEVSAVDQTRRRLPLEISCNCLQDDQGHRKRLTRG